jgi:pimeloyl-ACP methyl ester carboxylesterase
MPYANNDGIRIRYEVIGAGQPLVLHHGFLLDLNSWSEPGENWVAALQNDHQLILMDARGHGASDKPRDPDAYRAALRVSDVVAVLDDLKLKKAHFMGYSMGGGVGYAIAKHAPERFYSLIIGGASAEDDESEGPNPIVDVLRKGPAAVLALLEESFGEQPPEVKTSVMANDTEALAAMVSLREHNHFEAILPAVTLPCLIFVGDQDGAYAGAKRASTLLPNATFVSLPGDHLAGGSISAALPHVRQFLAEMSHQLPRTDESRTPTKPSHP